MTNFMPGPWKVILDASIDHGAIINNENIEIAKVDCRHGAIGEPEANAKLIASAPELLEALEGMVRKFYGVADTASEVAAIEVATIAIAKATGK